jgi:hypothetical protein
MEKTFALSLKKKKKKEAEAKTSTITAIAGPDRVKSLPAWFR